MEGVYRFKTNSRILKRLTSRTREVMLILSQSPLAMDLVGALTSFTAPNYCSTALLDCRYNDGDKHCTASYGWTCASNGRPTPAAECFPNGKRFVAVSDPTFSPGEACHAPYTTVDSFTYTTYSTSVDPNNFNLASTSYFKATQVVCCPLYVFSTIY
jgi:hypothetical protein